MLSKPSFTCSAVSKVYLGVKEVAQWVRDFCCVPDTVLGWDRNTFWSMFPGMHLSDRDEPITHSESHSVRFYPTSHLLSLYDL